MPTIKDLTEKNQIKMDLGDESKINLIRITDQAIDVANKLTFPVEEGRIIESPTYAFRIALQSAVQSVSALLSAASVQCNRDSPPADIEMKVDAGGRLVYRCYHSPAHEWDLTGNPL